MFYQTLAERPSHTSSQTGVWGFNVVQIWHVRKFGFEPVERHECHSTRFLFDYGFRQSINVVDILGRGTQRRAVRHGINRQFGTPPDEDGSIIVCSFHLPRVPVHPSRL